MKSYRITVNGNVYDVTVEETTGNEAATATHPVSNAEVLRLNLLFQERSLQLKYHKDRQ